LNVPPAAQTEGQENTGYALGDLNTEHLNTRTPVFSAKRIEAVMDEDTCLKLLNALLSNEGPFQIDVENTVAEVAGDNRSLYLKLMSEIRLIRCFGQLDSVAQLVTGRDINDVIVHINAEVTALSEKLSELQ
jgi:hypothetical protein